MTLSSLIILLNIYYSTLDCAHEDYRDYYYIKINDLEQQVFILTGKSYHEIKEGIII